MPISLHPPGPNRVRPTTTPTSNGPNRSATLADGETKYLALSGIRGTSTGLGNLSVWSSNPNKVVGYLDRSNLRRRTNNSDPRRISEGSGPGSERRNDSNAIPDVTYLVITKLQHFNSPPGGPLYIWVSSDETGETWHVTVTDS